MSSDEAIFRDTLRAFRKRRVEQEWEKLDEPNAARYAVLFAELHELGVTLMALSEQDSGLTLDIASQVAILRELGASVPALGMGLIAHITALHLLREAAGSERPPLLDDVLAGRRVALAANPLDRAPNPAFSLVANGTLSLSGTQRLALAYPEVLLVPARQGEQLKLCIVPLEQAGVRFASSGSSHGLCLVPVGDLTLDHVAVRGAQVLDWPRSGRASQQADGLLTALLAGMLDELADRAMGYALERYQGGKMIHEHDAVRQLVGPIQLGRRVVSSLALATLAETRAGDAGASAFAVELVRNAGLDAVQTFGGWGYMEDYRVERYLRDANTLETCWIHAAARQREIARERFAELAL